MPGPGSGTARAFIITSVGPLSVPVLIYLTKRPPEDLLQAAEAEIFANSWFYRLLHRCFFWTVLLPVVVSSFSLVFVQFVLCTLLSLMYTVSQP